MQSLKNSIKLYSGVQPIDKKNKINNYKNKHVSTILLFVYNYTSHEEMYNSSSEDQS